MTGTSYTAGSDDALLAMGLDKTANALGSAITGLGRAVMPGLRSAGRAVVEHAPQVMQGAKATLSKLSPGSMMKGMDALGRQAVRYTQPIERGIAAGAGKMFGPQGAQVARSLVRGVPGRMATDAVIGAGFGGLLEGGIGAATAEPGSRGSAFMRGFGSGAASGALGGAITGAGMGLSSNAARMGLRSQAARQGLSGVAANKAVNAVQNRGFLGNMRDLATGGAPGSLGRRGAAMGLAGTTAGLVAGAMPTPRVEFGGEQKTGEAKDDKRYWLSPYTTSMMLGTGLGTAGANIGLDLLEAAGHLPPNTLRKILATRLGPLPGSLLGAAAGHYVGTKLTENDG